MVSPPPPRAGIHELGVFVYAGAVLGIALTAAQLAPSGWRPAEACASTCATGVTLYLAYSRSGWLQRVLYCSAVGLGVVTCLLAFVPASAPSANPAVLAPSPSASASPSTSPSSPAVGTSAASRSTSISPAPSPQVTEAVAPVAQVRDFYQGALSVGVQSVYQTWAVLAVSTPATQCGTAFPSVGERIDVHVAGVLYRVTLMAVTPEKSAKLRIERRPDDPAYADYLACTS